VKRHAVDVWYGNLKILLPFAKFMAVKMKKGFEDNVVALAVMRQMVGCCLKTMTVGLMPWRQLRFTFFRFAVGTPAAAAERDCSMVKSCAYRWSGWLHSGLVSA